MKGDLPNARALHAPGRFLWAVLLGACTMAGPAPGGAPSPDAPPPDPVVQTGPISAGAEAQAARLFAQARDAFTAGGHAEALRVAEQVVSDFPRAAVSGRALLLSAEAAAAGGDALRADIAAERYIALLPPGDERAGPVRLIQAEAIQDPATRADRLLRIPSGASREDRARAEVMARDAIDQLGSFELAPVLADTPEDSPLRWLLELRAGIVALEEGDDAAATRYAERALALGASGADADIANGLMRGELPGGRQRFAAVQIATVLPTGGPPALADFAALVAEGVEVAAASVLGPRAQVTVRAVDNQADPALAASEVARLEREGVQGVIGFLEDRTFEAGGLARARGLPLVSPTARNASFAGEGAYSLEGADPLAAQSIARYAADQGYLRVAIVHSDAPESSEEADAFQSTIQALGIPVVGRFAYPTAATFYEEQIIAARDALRKAEIEALGLTEEDTLDVEMLEPVALFLPLPAEDVELVAPQVIHFGLDTLAIDLLGTSGWTDPQVLAETDNRITTGVVATAPVGRVDGSPGGERFRAAYEEHFQRSLVSPVPAVGYDAALLLLEALRDGPSTPGQIRANFERLREVEGATGIFSVFSGRVVRRTEVVYIDNGALVPIIF